MNEITPEIIKNIAKHITDEDIKQLTEHLTECHDPYYDINNMENNDIKKHANSELFTQSDLNLDMSILPKHIIGACIRAGYPLKIEQEMLIAGTMTVLQTMIQDDGLEETIRKFSNN